MTMGLINDFDFKEYLIDNTKDYEGQYSDQIRLLPKIYENESRLFFSNRLFILSRRFVL